MKYEIIVTTEGEFIKHEFGKEPEDFQNIVGGRIACVKIDNYVLLVNAEEVALEGENE